MNNNRQSIRLRHFDYSQQGGYFVTVCAQGKKCLFGEIVNGEMRLNGAREIVQKVWNELPNRFNIQLDAFVVMPNHVHFIVLINGVGAIHELPLQIQSRRQMLLPKIVGFFKMNTAKQINILISKNGPLWQRNYYEHIIRDEPDLHQIRDYIQNNPLKWEFDRENPINLKSSGGC